jgi:hypothetical protein
VEWSVFYLTNAVVMVLGLVQAELAPTLPLALLSFGALMLINATFFHVLPMVRTRGRFSPGIVTAVILFYPIGIMELVRSYDQNWLNFARAVAAFFIGGALMAYPIVMLRMKDRPYFRQDRA